MVADLKGLDGRVVDLAFTRDGKTLVAADRTTVKVWDVPPPGRD